MQELSNVQYRAELISVEVFHGILHGIVETTDLALRIFQKLNLNQTFRNGTNVVVSEVVQQLYSHRV